MPPPRNVPRPAKVVLGEALDELRERESYLGRFESEAAETRRVIKLLAKVIGEAEGHPRPTAHNPAGETRKAILECVSHSLDPLSMPEIAVKIGREPKGWLSMQLRRMVGAGELVTHDGERYGMPPALGVAAEVA